MRAACTVLFVGESKRNKLAFVHHNQYSQVHYCKQLDCRFCFKTVTEAGVYNGMYEKVMPV